MDYDDNEAQRRNLQLASEGRSKSSSVLRPYAFPRFDFDGSLPGNVRFDSLVETEVFLGIQGQEDSHWIEEYSRGNSLIEVSSAVTDSGSISWRHNVWSEATSLESVEMLLKSVGQEHSVHADSFFDNTNTVNELDNLAKKMETNQDKYNIDSACSRASDNTTQSNVLVSEIHTFEDHLEENVLLTDGNSLPQVSFTSTYEDSGHLGPSVPGDGFITSVTEEKLNVGRECGFKGGKEAECPIDEIMNSQKLEASSGMVNTSEQPTEIKDHNQEVIDDLSRGTDEPVKEQPMFSEAKAHTLAVEETAVTEALYTVGSSVDHLPSLDKGHSDATVSDLCTESGGSEYHSNVKDDYCIASSQLEAGEANVFYTSMIISDANRDNGLVTTGVEQVGCVIHTPNTELCPISETKRDSVEKSIHDFGDKKLENLGVGSQKKDSEFSVSTFDPSSARNEADEQSVHSDDLISNVHTGLPSLSAFEEQIKEKDGDERTKQLCGEYAMNAREFQLQGVSCFVPIFKEDNLSITREDCIKLSIDTLNRAVDGGRGSLALVGCSTVDEKRPEEAQSETAAEMVSVINSITNEKRNDVGDGDTGDVCVDPSMAESHCVGKEDVASQLSIIETSSSLDSSNQAETKVCRPTDSKDSLHAVGTQLSKFQDRSASTMKGIESHSAASSMSKNHSMGCVSQPDPLEETQNKTGSGSAGCTLKYKDTLLVGQDERKHLSSADSLEVGLSSPTMVSSDDRSPDEECKQQEARGSEVSGGFANTVQFISPCPRIQDTSEEDNSFTFKVSALPEVAQREKGKTWTPFSISKTYKPPLVLEQEAMRVPKASNVDQIDVRLTQETSSSFPIPAIPSEKNIQVRMPLEASGQSPKVSEGEWVGKTSKCISGHKGIRALGKGSAKGNSSKANNQKETTPKKSSRKKEISPNMPLSQLEKSPNVPFNLAGCTLPAFNPVGSERTHTLQQLFTDLQQVQLRAQIIVYGSLMQGVTPEEECMDSAFGPSDGRSMWESVWRAAVERVRKQKFCSSVETPAHSSAGDGAPEIAAKPSSQQNKVLPSPVSRFGSKGDAVPIVSPNSIGYLSSPLWSISAPSRDSSVSSGISRSAVGENQPALSPLHPFQTPPIQSFIGHTAWPSHSSFPPSSLAAQTSWLSPRSHFSSSMKDSSVPPLSVEKNRSNNLIVPAGDPRIVFAGPSTPIPEQTMAVTSSQISPTDSKPRRRKKYQTSIDVGQNLLISQSQAQKLSALPSAVPTSLMVAAASASTIPMSACTVSPVCAVSNIRSILPPIIGDLDNKDATCTEDTLRKVSEAKLQAEEAASLAESAVNHSQSVWNELSNQKKYGTISEAEAKMSSAAVAVVAAASVAKAAAAAARVASNAALQARLMADEVLLLGRSGNLPQSELFSSPSLGKKVDSSIHPGSILTAAREAARRRIEAATAATKQAENLEAIVRAAELTSGAISHARKVVSMGKPLPSKALTDSGPDGHGKLPSATSKSAAKSGSKHNQQTLLSVKETKGGPRVGVRDASDRKRDMLVSSLHVHLVADGISQSVTSTQNGENVLKGHNAESIEALAAPQNSSGSGTIENECEKLNSLHGNGINKGSPVEVYKLDSALKPVWFSASALALEDGKVLVSYSGPDNMKEWISLEGEKGGAPRIRVAPGMASHSQGTRKRRRTSTGDYTWNIGDRVDVQYQYCWWEGVVTELNDKDATTLTVHFPGRGQTSARSWQLRPSRGWVDGKWIELSRCSRARHSLEEDVPHEKRKRSKSPFAVSHREDMSESFETLERQSKEPRSLAVGASEKVFNIGHSTTRAGNMGDALTTTLRTGRQKEGSNPKMVFGVPKPGKKRKFVEVSKHYPAGSNTMVADSSIKKHEATDPVKFAKSLIPRAVAPCERKNFTKVDSKEKNTTIPGALMTTHKLSTGTYRSTARRQRTLKSDSSKDDENLTEQRAVMDDSTDRQSSDNEEAKEEGPLSSLFHGKLLGKLSSTLRKGPAAGNFNSKFEEDGENAKTSETACEASESRRSNRRIQPTQRLLEGLESSLIIPKMSSVLHDKRWS